MTPAEAWRQVVGYVDGMVAGDSSDAVALQEYVEKLNKEIDWTGPSVPPYGVAPAPLTAKIRTSLGEEPL